MTLRLLLSGVYVNGHRLLDVAVYGHEALVRTRGDVIIATHPFVLPKPAVYVKFLSLW